MSRNPSFPSSSRAISQTVMKFALSLFVASITSLTQIATIARAQSSASTTWAVSIILPPKLVAGKAATLAVLGVDGRLAEGITVTVGETLRLKTDRSRDFYHTLRCTRSCRERFRQQCGSFSGWG
jgi:hypothetical protein